MTQNYQAVGRGSDWWIEWVLLTHDRQLLCSGHAKKESDETQVAASQKDISIFSLLWSARDLLLFLARVTNETYTTLQPLPRRLAKRLNRTARHEARVRTRLIRGTDVRQLTLGAGCVISAQHADSDLREDATKCLVARSNQRPRGQLSHTRQLVDWLSYTEYRSFTYHSSWLNAKWAISKTLYPANWPN